jgi:hypothetical protein
MTLLARAIRDRPWNENGIRGMDDVKIHISSKREKKESNTIPIN